VEDEVKVDVECSLVVEVPKVDLVDEVVEDLSVENDLSVEDDVDVEGDRTAEVAFEEVAVELTVELVVGLKS
jgi:hypothetical protein